MRAAEVVGSAKGLVPFAHLCWGFADRAEFRERAGEYLSDALAAGQWIEYAGEGSPDALRQEVARLAGGQQALDAGCVGVYPIDEFHRFGPGRVVDPQGSLAAHVAAAEKALADGFPGVRMICDATSIARTPEQRDALARLEYLFDRKASVLPVSALCALDTTQLGTAAVAQLACLHPFVGVGSTAFRLYADEDTRLALAGELDLDCGELFAATLGRTLTLVEPAGEGLVVDVCGLTFADHRSVLALDAAAAARGIRIVLHSAAPIIAKLVDLLGLTNLNFADGPEAA